MLFGAEATDLDIREAPQDSFNAEETVQIHAAEGDAVHFNEGEATYSLVRRLYNWFGFVDETVPYTNQERTAIDVQRLINPQLQD